MKTVSKKLLSLLLVAILLVSALPFQAFADPHVADDPNHMAAVWGYDSVNHWQECPKVDCDSYGMHIAEAPHTYNENGVCVTCNYACTHANQGPKAGTEVAADCIHAGKAADTVCLDCGKLISEGAATAATGVHNFVNGVCSVCGTVQIGASYKLTLDAKGGTINGASSSIVDVKQGAAINVLPNPTREGYTFAGWFVDGVQITMGQAYPYDSDKTAEAKWTEITYLLTVRRVLNGNNSTAKTIHTVNVPAGTPLLNYLNTNVYSVVSAELALTPGYTWQYNFWKDYSGTQPLTSQSDCMNQAQTVYVNFVANAYTLYFDATSGGSVTPTSKTVYFGSPVGTLPTAYKSGKVFQGWKDASGNIYSSDTVYKVAGDTSLTAVWKDEALVILYIYINGDFSSCNRMIVMDRYVRNDNISRSDVYSEVVKYYTPASGVLSIAGLFDEYTWSSYRANTGKAGTENIQIDDSHPNKIYVMVNNAVTGSTIINGGTNIGSSNNGNSTTSTTTPQGAYWVDLGNNNGYWVYPAPTSTTYPGNSNNSNPKTGDTAKIEIAAAVMVLAAAGLITVMALRKKKSV